jgi:WD40 repeat protein
MTELYRFAAFLSYSSKDEAFARRLHAALEGFRIPKALGQFNLAGKANRVYPVFRDREELAAGTLGEELEAALRGSAALIVICSAHAATSHWVETEVRYFQSLGRGERVFAIVTDEAPTSSAGDDSPIEFLPAALRERSAEILAADARESKDGFRNAWLKIVAGLISVNAGALQDRDRRQRRRFALLAAGSGIAALVAVATSVNISDRANAREAFTARAVLLVERGDRAAALPFSLAGLGGSRPGAKAVVDRLGGRLPLVAVLPAPRDSQELQMSSDGKTLATRSANYELAMWDTATGARRGSTLNAEQFWFSDDAQRLVLLAQNHFEIVDVASGAAIAPPVQVLSTRSGDDVLVRAGVVVAQTDFNTLTAWDVHTGQLVATLHSPGVEMPVSVSPSGHRLISCNYEQDCILWDVAQQRKIASFKSLYGTVTFSPDDQRWVNNSKQHDAALWDATTGASVQRFSMDGEMGVPIFSSDGTRLVVFSDRGPGLLLDARTGALVASLGALDNGSNPVDFSADGRRLTTTGPKATGALWDAGSGKKIVSFSQAESANRMFISPDASRLIVQSFDQKTSLWDGITGAKVADLGVVASIESVMFSQSGKPFVIRTIDAGTSVWTDKGQALVDLGPESELDYVISRDGRRIAGLGRDSVIQLWDSSGSLAAGDGEVLRQRICAANGGATPAFRGLDRGGNDAVANYLKGRPWRVCEWRGLNEAAGWLQSARYWGVKARLWPDYREGE